jgi:hypothetical protein
VVCKEKKNEWEREERGEGRVEVIMLGKRRGVDSCM